MISFPLFTELEAKRDAVNAKFHRETEPQLIERFQIGRASCRERV